MEAIAGSRCPSAAELAQLQSAVPGRAPLDLARHLASCERCQQRALFGDSPRSVRQRRALPEWPSPKRALVLAGAVLVAIAMLFYSLQRLAQIFR